MGVNDIFAHNLGRIVASRGSVARVSRQLGMPRRQLQKYLAGEIFPERSTLERIVRGLKITEDALFRTGDESTGGLRRLPKFGAADGIASRQAGELREGFYETWFWTPAYRSMLFGAVTAVRRMGDYTTFRRLTARAEALGSRFGFIRGDHSGVVTSHLTHHYFTGISGTEPCEPSMLAVSRATTERYILTGTGTVLSPKGPVAVNVVMIHHPKGRLRSLLTNSQVVQRSKAKIDSQIAMLLIAT